MPPRELGTAARSVSAGWRPGCCPRTTCKRFPYEEHPFNIALVLGAGGGARRRPRLRAEGDGGPGRAGPRRAEDIPAAPVRTRRLEFINGMSANERHGASQLDPLGFDTQDPYAEPGVWLTTVVNNRADRVPRSRVFAACSSTTSLPTGMSDRRQPGRFAGYIEEAWSAAAGMTLCRNRRGAGAADPVETLDSIARRLRLPYEDEHVEGFLRAMLKGQPGPLDTEALLAVPDRRTKCAAARRGGHRRGGTSSNISPGPGARHRIPTLPGTHPRRGRPQALDASFAERLEDLVPAKILVVEDYYSSGDRDGERIRPKRRPACSTRHGRSNIKGTGLDFVSAGRPRVASGLRDGGRRRSRAGRARPPDPAAPGIRRLDRGNGRRPGAPACGRCRRCRVRLSDQLDLVLGNLDRQMASCARAWP